MPQLTERTEETSSGQRISRAVCVFQQTCDFEVAASLSAELNCVVLQCGMRVGGGEHRRGGCLN